MTRGKFAAAGAIALGLTLIAGPAQAVDGDAAPKPVLEVENPTFHAGSWGDGIDVSVTEVPEGVDEVHVTLGAQAEQGGGLVMEPVIVNDEDSDGVFTATLQPGDEVAPVAPDEDGYPYYTVNAGYETGELNEHGNPVMEWSEPVTLTILEGAAVTGPETVTVAQLESDEGVILEFKGFLPDETLNGVIKLTRDGELLGEEIGQFSTTVGPDGNGTGSLWVTGAQVDDYIQVTANGEESSVNFGTRVVAGEDDTPTDEPNDDPKDEPNDDSDNPTQPTKPERIETNA